MTAHMSRKPYAFAIVGGGLAGWALTRALLRQGVAAEEMVLLERQMPASGSSGVLYGMMHPFTGRTLYPKPGYLEAWRYSLNWLAEIQQEGSQKLYRTLPLWRIAQTEAAARQFARSYQRALELPNYPLHALDPVPEWFRSLASEQEVRVAYALEQAAQIQTPALIAHLARQHPVTRYYHGGRVQLQPRASVWDLQTQQGHFQAQQVILSCGSGLEDYFPALEVSYKRGEVCLFELPGTLPAAISGSGRYAATVAPNRHMTGATFYHGTRPWSPAQSWADLQTRMRWWPELRQARPLQIWSGVRAIVKRDREALTGPVPGWPGLWLHAAYSTRGLLQIPLASQSLAAELCAKPGQIPAWMRPERLPEVSWQAGRLFQT